MHVVRDLARTAVAWGGLAAHLTAPRPAHPVGAVIAASVLTLVFIFFTELADLLIAPSAHAPR
ncbi:hypothetical protein [Actinoallomurus sp. CA-150999]|uniref:hypothetical protein n=1 Tax=Actinoallomurus sp. CA-150999 TaxID=3239887 RepID=UPI003D92F3D9